jgi:hypothetical protein
MHGIRRKPYQVLPKSGARITCVQINDHGFNTFDWFKQSVHKWEEGQEPILWRYPEWDFVLVIPWISVRSYWSSNDGMQAWRHREEGNVVPDHCRQTGGCPEVWTSADVKGKRELAIANLQEIESFVVLDHSSVSRSAFPEHSVRRVSPTSLL